MSGVAVALGSKDEGTELTAGSAAITTGETWSDPARGFALEDSLVWETVSVGEGAGLFGELQPGFAKIRISAKRWMPTTIPKIFRIFIGGLVERL